MHFSLLLALASSATAHQMFTTMSVSGKSFGDGTCLRVPPNTDPLTSLSDKSIVCNVGGDKSVARTCDIDAGQEITLQWRTWPDGSRNDPIDVSHQGPCAVYMKKVYSFTDPIEGNGWFKIWHDGYSDGMFCAERVRRSGGLMTARVPKDLAGGDYLIRGEMLALHEAANVGGAQFFVSCAQIHVYSTGGSADPPTVSIPGYIDPNHPGVHYDLWANSIALPYQIPGPAPYVPTSAGGGPRVGPFNPPTPCPVSNANWCSRPVSEFSNEAECYKSSGDCWAQSTACYDQAPVTGNKGCKEYEAICAGYNEYCGKCGAAKNCAGKFPGS